VDHIGFPRYAARISTNDDLLPQDTRTDIVLPVYLVHWNAPEWCGSAARSLLATQGLRVDLTVIDNGPGGGNLTSALPRGVRVIATGGNLGYTGGANVAIGRWLATTSAPFAVIGSHDLRVQPTTLLKLYETARAYGDFGVLGPVLDEPTHSSGGSWNGYRAWQLPAEAVAVSDDGRRPMDRQWLSGTCLFLRRAAIEGVGGFDPGFSSYVEDVEFGLRARDHGWRVGVVPSAHVSGIGSVAGSARTSVMIEANWTRLAALRGGLPQAARVMLTIAYRAARGGVGSLIVLHSHQRRRLARQYAVQHSAALLMGFRRLEAWRKENHGRPLVPHNPEPQPTITVVIPTCRGRLPFLRETIGRILAQTHYDWRLIVVDVASSDDTARWLSELEDPRISVLAVPTGSPVSFARSRGLENVETEYVLFLDDDDRLRPDAFKVLLTQVDEAPNAIAAMGAHVDSDDSGNVVPVAHPRQHHIRDIWSDVLCGWTPCQAATLFRTEAVRRAGAFPEHLASPEDLDFFLRASRLGPFALLPQIVVEKRLRPFGLGEAKTDHDAFGVRANHVAQLSDHEKTRASPLLAAFALFGQARVALDQNLGAVALVADLRALHRAPEVLVSPLLAPVVGRSVGQAFVACLLGKQATRLRRNSTRLLVPDIVRQPGDREEI
jgi:N-acetylglucosaminyl-diphospho-decaprenol L-rhamnosyltransferase